MNKFTVIDLTYPLNPEIPTWNGGCGFNQMVESDYDQTSSTTKFRIHELVMKAGVGTHMDSPQHCFKDGLSIADLNPDDLVSPGIVIDTPQNASDDYKVSVDDITRFEESYGSITEGNFVIIRTGWGKFWSQPEKYRNKLSFPSVSAEAAQLLVDRQISGLGIDTLSPDTAKSGFPVHRIILGANKYIVENIANSHLLPSFGFHIFALPLKIQEGTESPIRLIAIIPKENQTQFEI